MLFNLFQQYEVNTNQPCFITAGGPSLCDFDYSVLKPYFTIGVNKSFKYYTPNMLYCMDLKLYDYVLGRSKHVLMKEDAYIESQWRSCKSTKVFPRPTRRFAFESDIHVVNRIQHRVVSKSLKDGIYPGNNVGFGAMMLAIALGFTDIYLLGVDMKLKDGRSHFHEGYYNTSIDRQLIFYTHFTTLFNKMAPKLKDAGITVTNLNMDSAVECFRKDTIKNALDRLNRCSEVA